MIVICSDYERAKKDFFKKWPEEMKAIINNLNTLLESLEAGARPTQLSNLGFVHVGYPLGILSIDQRGHEKSTKPKALRLYVFPFEEEQQLYVMLIGDKARQSKDVGLCKEFVAKLIDSQSQKPT